MAKIENYTLHTLENTARQLQIYIDSAQTTAMEAETEYNRQVAIIKEYQEQLKNVQDSISTLTKPKKAKNVSKD